MHTRLKWFWKLLGITHREPPAGARVHHSVPWLQREIGYENPRLPDDILIVGDPGDEPGVVASRLAQESAEA